MNYKRTTYEIIENYPSILRNEIPLIQITMGAIYILIVPFVMISLFIRKGFSLFSRIELSQGAEDNRLIVHFNLLSLDHFILEPDEVVSTESIYMNKTETAHIVEVLEKKGFEIKANVKGDFRLKKRNEECFSKISKPDEELVILAVPLIALKINAFYRKLRLI